MRSRIAFAVMMVLSISLCTLIVPIVVAHAPNFPGSNESLPTATVVQDPTKSWAIYTDLHEGGEAQYYRLDMKAGQTIYAQLIVPIESVANGFVPSMVLMGPGLNSSGDIPIFVQNPDNAGLMVLGGEVPQKPTYEAFSPGAFYQLANTSLIAPVDGTYYVAVYNLTTGGSYGLAIGQKESFTVSEWLLIPLSVISIYQWEGQTLTLILIPWITTMILGFVVIAAWRKKEFLSQPLRWQLCVLGGLLIVGSGVSVLAQMINALSSTGWTPDAILTVVFAIISLTIGSLIVIAGLKPEKDSESLWRRRTIMVVLGALALLFWGGLIVGPIVVIASSLLPGWRLRSR